MNSRKNHTKGLRKRENTLKATRILNKVEERPLEGKSSRRRAWNPASRSGSKGPYALSYQQVPPVTAPFLPRQECIDPMLNLTRQITTLVVAIAERKKGIAGRGMASV